LMGITVGGGMIVATTMIQLEIKHEYIGIGTSLAVTARNVGGAVAERLRTGTFHSKNACPRGSEYEYSATDLY
jgi:hypothetical protein